VCVNNQCCSAERSCGGVCCPAGQYCSDVSKKLCSTCPPKTFPCLPDHPPAICCPENVACCPGVCCKPGESCNLIAPGKYACGPAQVPR
jgi:hypothetical protein